jgi:hypothetical protein
MCSTLNHLILIIIAINIVACDVTRDNIFAPNKRIFKQIPDNADDYEDYKQGWLDGCETGMATGFSNDYYKTFYKFNKDKEMVKNGVKPYLRAWSTAMIFCRHYVLATLKEAGMQPRLPGQGFPFPLGGENDEGHAFGHGVFKTWDFNKHGAQGLSRW